MSALKVKFVPAGPVGVPESVPSDWRVSPAGKVVPPARLQVKVPVPPDSVRVAE